jgi:hypothetical protein
MLEHVSLRYNGPVGEPTVPRGKKKRDRVLLVIWHQDEAAAALSHKGSRLATIVPCDPRHPLGAFTNQGKISRDNVDIGRADYTHRVLSRWVIDDKNQPQVRELARTVGVKAGKNQRTRQHVNYETMEAADSREGFTVNVTNARVHADAWVFPLVNLTRVNLTSNVEEYRSALVFCPVPYHATPIVYRHSVAWATYTAMYACAQLGIDVVVLASLYTEHAKDVETMLRGGHLPDGSQVPQLGSHFAKVILCVGPSRAPSRAPSSGPSRAPSSGPSRAPSSGPSRAPSRAQPRAPTLKRMGVLGDKGNVPTGHVVVDPAGLQFIRDNTPGKARALSEAVYRFLGISVFPQGVRAAITKAGRAAHHTYTRRGAEKTDVIHVVGPNFEELSHKMWHDAVRKLKKAYASVLRVAENLHTDLRVIRLPVISGGKFSGKFGEHGCVPELTARAVLAAFAEHGEVKKEYWLCTFTDADGMHRYERAFALAASVRHYDFKSRGAIGPRGAVGPLGVVGEVRHEYGAVGYAAEISGGGNRVGVMVAGNSGRPAGEIGDPLAHIPTIFHDTVRKGFQGLLDTQEESVVSEWLHGEYPGHTESDLKKRAMLYRSTICGLWGQCQRQSHKTIQRVDYRSAKAEQYADAWVVRDAKLRHRGFGARDSVSATLVFVAGPNAKKMPEPSDPTKYGSMWSTANTQAINDYAFFEQCVEASVRAGLLAMQAEGVTHALVACVSCGIYAGTPAYRDQIKSAFVGLVRKAAEEIAYDAAIVVVGIKKSGV